MIEMTWPWATAHVSWQFIGNNICDKWSYFTSEILSVLLKYSPRRRRDGDEPRLFPGVGSRSLHTPYHTNPASPPMLTVSRHVSDGWQCLEPRVQYSEKVLCKAWNSESRLSEDYLFKRAFFTSSPRIALSIHSIVRVHVWLGEGGRARIKLIKVLFVIVMRAAGTGRRSLSEKLVTSFEYNLDVNCRFWLSRWGDVPAAGCGDDGCLLWQLLTVHCPPAAASTHAHMGDYS